MDTNIVKDDDKDNTINIVQYEDNDKHEDIDDIEDIDIDETVSKILETPLYIIYNEKKEIDEELQLFNYHKSKDYGYWKIAKMIISHSINDKNNTEFFLDLLDIELHKNNDSLENIEKVFYTNNLDIDMVYEFRGSIAKFIVENLKIYKFKQLGYIFNNDINQNKWNFTISVITNKSIYTSNRYISINQIGFY